MQWQEQAYAVPTTVKALPAIISRRARTLSPMGLNGHSVIARVLGAVSMLNIG
jgi:hypothetical protein